MTKMTCMIVKWGILWRIMSHFMTRGASSVVQARPPSPLATRVQVSVKSSAAARPGLAWRLRSFARRVVCVFERIEAPFVWTVESKAGYWSRIQSRTLILDDWCVFLWTTDLMKNRRPVFLSRKVLCLNHTHFQLPDQLSVRFDSWSGQGANLLKFLLQQNKRSVSSKNVKPLLEPRFDRVFNVDCQINEFVLFHSSGPSPSNACCIITSTTLSVLFAPNFGCFCSTRPTSFGFFCSPCLLFYVFELWMFGMKVL